jgi:hypothetical protein
LSPNPPIDHNTTLTRAPQEQSPDHPYCSYSTILRFNHVVNIAVYCTSGVPINLIFMESSPGGMGDRLSKLRQPAFYGAGGGDGGVVLHEVFVPLLGVQFGEFDFLLTGEYAQ